MTGSEWVKCDYYMPPSDENILMYYESNMVVGFYHTHSDTEFWGVYVDGWHYTTTEDAPLYWMPLPKPPKEFTTEGTND